MAILYVCDFITILNIIVKQSDKFHEKLGGGIVNLVKGN